MEYIDGELYIVKCFSFKGLIYNSELWTFSPSKFVEDFLNFGTDEGFVIVQQFKL